MIIKVVSEFAFFYISARQCRKLKKGDTGVTYNKAEYLSFVSSAGSESRKGTLGKIFENKKTTIAAVILIFGIIVIGGKTFWKNQNAEQEVQIEDMEDKPLEVYLVGNQMHSNNEETEKVFQTLYMLGEFTPTASQRGQGG